MRVADAEAMGKEFFVSLTLDPGFRNVDVFRTLQKVMATRKGVKGMEAVFRQHLTTGGHIFAMEFCDVWIKGGLWGCVAYYSDKVEKVES